MQPSIKIATRGSKLALIQTHLVKNALLRHFPELHIQIQIIPTTGDIDQQTPLAELGKKPVFTDTLEDALLNQSADLVVHSMKDMSFPEHPALLIAGVLPREDPRDVLVHQHQKRLKELDGSDIIATCSNRRKLQLKQLYPVTITNIRGNVEERIQKMQEGAATGLILAAAGLHRLGLQHLISDYCDTQTMMPSPCQGIIAIQCRRSDERTRFFLQQINHTITYQIAQIEKQWVTLTGGICEMNYSCLATPVNNHQFELIVSVIKERGEKYSTSVIGEARGLAEKALLQLNTIQHTTTASYYAYA